MALTTPKANLDAGFGAIKNDNFCQVVILSGSEAGARDHTKAASPMPWIGMRLLRAALEILDAASPPHAVVRSFAELSALLRMTSPMGVYSQKSRLGDVGVPRPAPLARSSAGATRLRPAFFASYNAASAACSTFSRFAAASPVATPRLRLT